MADLIVLCAAVTLSIIYYAGFFPLIIFIILCVSLYYYDDILPRILEFAWLESGHTVKSANGIKHAKVTLDGKSYDLFIPFDASIAKNMRKNKYLADDEIALSPLPGYLPQCSVSNMGFKTIKVTSRGKTSLYEGNQEPIWDVKL